jgi:hypothetical protein
VKGRSERNTLEKTCTHVTHTTSCFTQLKNKGYTSQNVHPFFVEKYDQIGFPFANHISQESDCGHGVLRRVRWSLVFMSFGSQREREKLMCVTSLTTHRRKGLFAQF